MAAFEQDYSGLYGRAEGQESPALVPLAKVNVKAEVLDFVARVEVRYKATVHGGTNIPKFGALQVEQEYVNREELPIEAVYYFPVEEDAAVVGFHAELEGRYRTIR